MSDSIKNTRQTGRKDHEKKTRKLVYQIRMNEDEANLLDMLSDVTDDTKADVLRKALKMYASVNGNRY